MCFSFTGLVSIPVFELSLELGIAVSVKLEACRFFHYLPHQNVRDRSELAVTIFGNNTETRL